MADKKLSRIRQWLAGASAWLVMSRRMFLLGLIIACGVEVISDWNVTLKDINTLRGNIRSKATSYTSILRKPATEALRSSNLGEMKTLTEGVFDDADAVCVRLYDAAGRPVYQAMRPDYEPVFAPRSAFYERLMKRDVAGMLKSPEAYKQRVANSRFRDFAQWWTDSMAKVWSWFSGARQKPARYELILYQDRLRDENREHDERMTWEVAVLKDAGGANAGALLVGFDMRRTNEAVNAKYLKGLGVTALFVALIVIQRLTSRRDKLRMLDLEQRYKHAKSAVVDALPKGPQEFAALRVVGALHQAAGVVDGMIWNVVNAGKRVLAIAIDPDGDGIQAAVVALHMTQAFRNRAGEIEQDLDRGLELLGQATDAVPLTRPIGLALVAMAADSGAYEARITSIGELWVIDGATTAGPSIAPSLSPPGIVGPVGKCEGVLAAGASLVVTCWGRGPKPVAIDTRAVVAYLRRAHRAGTDLPVEDAATWTRGRTPGLAASDVVIMAITRRV